MTEWQKRVDDVLRGLGWPYGAQDRQTQEHLLKWAEARRVSRAKGGPCLHWLAKGRCGVAICREGHGSQPWRDHLTGWIYAGRPAILLAQPYHICRADLADLATIEERWGVLPVIHGWGWYGHGTACIELRSPWYEEQLYRRNFPVPTEAV
jgi:hypothetical protein